MGALWVPAGLALCVAAYADAPLVSLQGMLGQKALLLVDGKLRTLGAGQSADGVTVISTANDQAQVEVDHARYTLHMGDTPGNLNGAASGTGQIILTSDNRGNFAGQGRIDGKPIQFIVDTGATLVTIGKPEADQMGIHYQSGNRLASHTANGTVIGWHIKLQSLNINDVTVHDVDTMVVPADLPKMLLGNSFLNRFHMQRDADRLVLTQQ